MHETYLLPFAEAVREGSASIMCSYNKINGTAVCQNTAVLDLVKKASSFTCTAKCCLAYRDPDQQELNFPGFIISDWGKSCLGCVVRVCADRGCYSSLQERSEMEPLANLPERT